MNSNKYSALEIAEGRHLSPVCEWGSCHVDFYKKDMSRLNINHDEVIPEVHIGSVPATNADFDHIRAQGFGAVLDMCGDNPDEGAECEKRGIRFQSVRVHDGYSPTQEQFKVIVEYLRKAVDDGLKVYVHCHAGAGRAPTAVAAYLLYKGCNLDLALDTIEARRRVFAVSRYQILGLTTFIKRHGRSQNKEKQQ